MVATPAVLEDYRLHAPVEAALGHICWYSMSELCVDHAQVKAMLTTVGLKAHVPPYPKDHDVFKRVTTAAQRRKVPTNRTGVYRNYMIRPVSEKGEGTITRRIVVETRNAAGKKLAYEQVRDFDYDRDMAVIRVRDLYATPRQDPQVEAITQEVLDGFTQWRGRLNAYAIREMIRHLLLKAGATMLRDGVYFLPEAQSATLDAVERFANDLDPAIDFHSLVLLDDVKQRKMIRRAFEADSIDAIDVMMEQIAEVRKGGKPISADRYARMLDDYRGLVARTTEYEGLLETGLGETKIRLNVFQRQIVQLLEMVKH